MPPATAAGNARHYTTRAPLFKRFRGIMTEEPAPAQAVCSLYVAQNILAIPRCVC